ncbi:DNA-directed RNA polymerase subunit E'' [Candidatus Parvarchaeota archaeon]|nr:DNA-directed RNA polymerase subunit E'' [Candidatus Parvarchaeota archaeon]
MALKACKVCNYLSDAKKCPMCGNEEMSLRWKGEIIVVDPEKSETAKKLNITKAGKYALSVD